MFLSAQQTNSENLIQSGNDLFQQKKYEQAILKYQDALKNDPANYTAKYNLAVAQFRLQKEQESIKAFQSLSSNKQRNTELRSISYFNEGAILSQQKNLEGSIEAYKNALRLNPGDTEARENLQKALLELKKKQEEKPPPPPKKENQKQQQSRLNSREVEKKLSQLEEKEKQVQQKVQKEKTSTGNSKPKDW